MIKISFNKNGRLNQGDVFQNIDYFELFQDKGGELSIQKINFPYVVVLTQDCDLQHDYKVRWAKKKYRDHDKRLMSVIVAPLYVEDHVFNGEHLSDLGYKMQKIEKYSKKKLTTKAQLMLNNEIPRYHYIEFPKDVEIVNSFIDFKHYFSVNVEYLKQSKKNHYICTISPIFRERLCQRFSNYLNRIGLPEVGAPAT